MIAATARQVLTKRHAVVESCEPVGDGLVRIVLDAGPAPLAWRPGQAVGVVVDADATRMRDRWRHLTIRRWRSGGHLELLLLERSPTTPLGRWLAGLGPGVEITFQGPGGRAGTAPSDAPILFLGDRTSLAGIAAVLENRAPGAAPCRAVVVTPDPPRADLTAPGDVEWVAAEDGSQDAHRSLTDALPDTPPPGLHVHVSGELAVVDAVRRRMRDAGLAGRRLHGHPHWSPDRTGM